MYILEDAIAAGRNAMSFLADLDPLLKLLEIISILGAGGLAVIKMVQTSTEVKATLVRQNEIIDEMKSEMKDSMSSINSAITKLAVYDSRLERIEEDIREMRHGRSFIIDPPAALLAPPSAPPSRRQGS